MKSLSKELGANGITVNKIILAKDISLDSINLDDILSFICSAKSAFITGQILR